MTKLEFLVPSECGLASEAKAVARRVSDLLNALGDINYWVASGPMVNLCYEFQQSLIEKLRAEGWRITADKKWKVLQPKGLYK